MNLGPESGKLWESSEHFRKLIESANNGLDIGYGVAYDPLPGFNGIEARDYDGVTLPYKDGNFDIVYSSHVLEHVPDAVSFTREMFRVCRPGGHLIIVVPHQYLYEKRHELPSRYNRDHKRYFTPGQLLRLVEVALEPNHYRVRSCFDDDHKYNYSIPPDRHADGNYSIFLDIQRLEPPPWILA